MIKLAVSGACGKMGSRIISLAKEDKELKVIIGLERKGHEMVGKFVGDIKISDNPEEIKDADVLIEFTNPEATIEHLDFVLRYKKSLVIGTTGLNEEQKERIKEASKSVPVIFSPNMSVAVNLLFRLVRETAEILKDYGVSITEAHHIHKKDAPSGTAKRLAEIIKEAQGKEIKDIKSIREDEIVGDHEVVFDSPLDTVKLSHSAKTRDIFAKGALEAAKFVIKKNKGLYDMQDALNKNC